MNVSKDDFQVDPALNIPFGGGTGSGTLGNLNRDRLRLLKRELEFNPSAAYVNDAIKEFVPGMRDELSKIPKGSNLIIMPSSTGFNKVPAELAINLKKQRKDLRLINADETIIRTTHQTESKIKQNYEARAEDPRRFQFTEPKIAKLAEQGRPSYIVDDSISTGESAIILQRQLSKRGVHAQGIIAAVSTEKYTYASDMVRIYDKVTQDYSKDYAPEQIRQDVYTQFAGFPRKKAADFERSLASSNPDKRESAIRYLRQSSAYYRQEQLDPASVLERTSSERTPWVERKQLGLYDQLKSDYPNLSEEDINRYTKTIQQQKLSGSKGKGLGWEIE